MAKKSNEPVFDETIEFQARAIAAGNLMKDFVDGEGVTVQDDEGLEVKDPNVEFLKQMAEMGLAAGDYKDLLLQVTNFDHPIQAQCIAKDGVQLEWMRQAGMPKAIYEIIHGKDKSFSGYFGILRARQGILYPGPQGFEAHPRMQLFNSILGRRRGDTEKGRSSLGEKLSSLMSR